MKMIGTCRVRSLPRMSSASSKPSISGICTSRRARATSWTRSSSSASGPERAVKISTSCRRSNADNASRFSSRSSTSRHFTNFSIRLSQGAEQLCYLRERQYEIRRAALQGGHYHERHFGAVRLLNHGDASSLMDGMQSSGTILVPSSENDAEQPLAIDIGSGFEQYVDGGPREMHRLVGGQGYLAVFLDQHVVVRRGEIDGARLERLLVVGFPNRPGAAFRKDIHEQARPLSWQMQNDEQGGKKSGGQGRQKLCQRFDAPGRGADDPAVNPGRPRFQGNHDCFLSDGIMAASGRCARREPVRQTHPSVTRSAGFPSSRCRGSPCGTVTPETAPPRGPAGRD